MPLLIFSRHFRPFLVALVLGSILVCSGPLPATGSVEHTSAAFFAPVPPDTGSTTFSFTPNVASPFENNKKVATDGSFVEHVFSGNFIGSLLFGLPYKGFGAVDAGILVLTLLFVMRLLSPRRKKNDDDRLLGSRNTTPRQPLPGQRQGQARSQHNTPWPRQTDNGSRNANRLNQPVPPGQQHITVKDQAKSLWAYYGGDSAQDTAGKAANPSRASNGFDKDSFLEGARTLYTRLQKSWASRDLEDLIPFVTPGMMRRLEEQARNSPQPVYIDVVLVNAVLSTIAPLPSGEEGERASVRFQALMRLTGNAAPQEIREEWFFIRGPNTNGLWQLDGISQTSSSGSA